MTDSRAPGWFPSPTNPEEELYWDGTDWTQTSRPRAGDARTGRGEHSDSRAGVALWLTGMALMILGFLWILVFYLSQSSFPVQTLGGYNIVVGLVIFVPGAVLLTAGLIVATRGKHQQARS